jgi:predicted lipoprotein with Yx(FWY)xxD motif
MHRALTLAAVAATLTIAACGSSNSSSDQAASGATGAGPDTVGIKQVSGVGRVLVGPTGLALYTPDQEAKGTIRCTGPCTSEWLPLATKAHPTAAAGAGKIDVIKRPDGARQVTLNGMPLYTFANDAPSKVTGDGETDKFGGQSFTWHVVLADGAKGTAGTADTNNPNGY